MHALFLLSLSKTQNYQKIHPSSPVSLTLGSHEFLISEFKKVQRKLSRQKMCPY